MQEAEEANQNEAKAHSHNRTCFARPAAFRTKTTTSTHSQTSIAVVCVKSRCKVQWLKCALSNLVQRKLVQNAIKREEKRKWCETGKAISVRKTT